jgi:hypothetical protein
MVLRTTLEGQVLESLQVKGARPEVLCPPSAPGNNVMSTF